MGADLGVEPGERLEMHALLSQGEAALAADLRALGAELPLPAAE